MDQRNPFRPRQRGQRRRIAPQGEGRFRRQRQSDVLGPQRFQRRHHLTPSGGDNGAKAGGDLCLGNLQRAAFHPTRTERGQHLQKGRGRGGHGAGLARNEA